MLRYLCWPPSHPIPSLSTTPLPLRARPCAGFAYKGSIFGADECQATLDINFFGTMAVCERLKPLLKPPARIVNVSSRYVFAAGPGGVGAGGRGHGREGSPDKAHVNGAGLPTSGAASECVVGAVRTRPSPPTHRIAGGWLVSNHAHAHMH